MNATVEQLAPVEQHAVSDWVVAKTLSIQRSSKFC